jgi:hypothetical protein
LIVTGRGIEQYPGRNFVFLNATHHHNWASWPATMERCSAPSPAQS